MRRTCNTSLEALTITIAAKKTEYVLRCQPNLSFLWGLVFFFQKKCIKSGGTQGLLAFSAKRSADPGAMLLCCFVYMVIGAGSPSLRQKRKTPLRGSGLRLKDLFLQWISHFKAQELAKT